MFSISSRGAQITRSIHCKWLSSSRDASLSVTEDGKRLLIDNSKSYHSKWLRHHCSCEECKASTGQRTIPFNILKNNILIKDASLKDDRVYVNWVNDDDDVHSGFINIDWLAENHYTNEVIHKMNTLMEPSAPVTSFSFIDYDEVVTSDEGFWKWLYCLNDKGHCIMNGVPTDTKHTTLICEKISHIQKTIYDEYSDVETVDNPINIAYTNTGLDFHIDLVYYQSPPGLLMLHCYRNDRVVEGGLSILVDGLAVANDMRETHPKQFDVLTKIPATFKKIHYERDNPVHMIRNQPHIILDRNGRIIRLNWAPLFEGTLSIPENKLEDYYDAYCTFHKCLSESPHRLTHRLEPGQMLSFNNLRMFHGRTMIETNGGKRHFKGFYVNIDEFVSKLNILSNQLNKKEPIKHVLNGSHYL